MFVNFSEEVRHLLKQAEKEKEVLNHPYVGSEHLFLSILKESKLINFLKNYKLTYQRFKDKLISLVGVGSKKSHFTLYTPLLKRVLENSIIEAREENNRIVTPEIIIISILDEEDGVAFSILKSLNINTDKLYYDLRNKKNNRTVKIKKLLLDDIATNLTKLAKERKLDPVIGRDKEINKAIEILLRRKKNNPILIGPAGVGKTAIVEGIANLMVSDKCPVYLKNKRIYSLNIFSVVSGTKYRGEFEEKMKNLIKELEENQDIILFIDEVHTIVGAGGAEGAIDASNIFKPALARGMIRIIGATTIDEYKKYIEPDQALARRFQSIVIEEPELNDVINILTKTKQLYENYHNIKISDDLIEEIAVLSDKYLTNRFEPDRSIDILDEVCAKVSVKENVNQKKMKDLMDKLNSVRKDKINAIEGNDFKKALVLKSKENKIRKEIDTIKITKNSVTKEDVLSVIKSKGNLKNIEINNLNIPFYNKLEENLNKKIIGQEKAVKKLVDSLKKKNIINEKKPYVVLIAGQKGSGKSYLANTFLNYITNKKNIIKIDLSEYKEYMTISKLIGTTAGYVGYDNKNNVFEKVRTNPSSALLIENFNDACSDVKSLFYKIVKEGKIEDSSSKVIDFTNASLIFTFDCNNEKKVGFDTSLKVNSDMPKILDSNAQVKIDLKVLDDKDKKIIIRNKIEELKNKYSNININIDDDFDNYVLKSVKDDNDISKLVSFVKDSIIDEVIKSVIAGNKNVNIDIKSMKIS